MLLAVLVLLGEAEGRNRAGLSPFSTFHSSPNPRRCAAARRPRWSCATGAREASTPSRSRIWLTAAPRESVQPRSSTTFADAAGTRRAIAGTNEAIARELADGRPILTLIEDRPGTFHYIVIIGATPRAIVYHDPARTAFRTMSRDDFDRRWSAAGHWMALVVPMAAGPTAAIEHRHRRRS